MPASEDQRPPLPRHGLLREITDRAVLTELLTHGRATRSELARATGISKPTISESTRRLEAAGLVHDSGTRSGHQGRTATYVEIAARAGWVLALNADESGLQARCTDLMGATFHERSYPPGATGDTAHVIRRIRSATRQAEKVGQPQHGVLRAVGLSVSNAVDPRTSKVIALPSTSFPGGRFDPAAVLADVVDAPIVVDNDMNCAALAEHRDGAAIGEDNFAYISVGAGLGMGLYSGGRMIRGAHGLAGEIGYLATATGPAQYSTLVKSLARQGFGAPDSAALDVPTIRRSLSATRRADSAAEKAAQTLGAAIGQMIIATCAVVDPELVLLGGPLGRHPVLFDAARSTVADLFPTPVRIELGLVGPTASLQGAAHLAVDHARRHLVGTG